MATKVLFFHADWDRNNDKLLHVFDTVTREMEKSKNYEFQAIDVETEDGVQASIDYQVRNVPTLLIVKRNRVIERHKGSFTLSELFKIIKRW